LSRQVTARRRRISSASAHARWRWSEIAFWLLARSPAIWLFPSRYLIMTEIAMRLALFALSLDLILGYAGIVSLGHAAFFGVGAYCAGLLACTASSPTRGASRCLAGLRRPRSAFSPASW
jgi:ABC-type branched-subunit amino acid transport system permease subunit